MMKNDTAQDDTNRKQQIVRRKNFLLGLVGILFVVGLISWGVLSYVRVLSIDIHSARIRETRRIYMFETDRKIRETAVTKILVESGIPLDSPLWKTDGTFTFFSPGVSPHYQYHGAVSRVNGVEKLFEWYEINEENRLKISLYTLEWLQGDNGKFKKSFGPIGVWETLVARKIIEMSDPAAMNRSLQACFPASLTEAEAILDKQSLGLTEKCNTK